MPANLTPEYRRAEDRYRAAKTIPDKIAALEEMLRVMPKHKGTDHLQADVKARIAKLRKESTKKGVRATVSYVLSREGAGQVALVGPPNSGKSSLVRALTHATPAVGDYPFTTREPVPGMMPFEDIAFQLVDLPPVSAEHVEAWVFDAIRHADLVWIVLDARDALEGFDEVRRLAGARNIMLSPATDALSDDGPVGVVVRRAIVVLTGADRAEAAGAAAALGELLDGRWPIVAVSSTTGAGLDVLPRQTFELMNLVRVYTKQPGKPPDRRAPFALPRGATVADLAARIHNDLVDQLKFARVWGESAFDGQAVQKDHPLAEGDVVEIHT